MSKPLNDSQLESLRNIAIDKSTAYVHRLRAEMLRRRGLYQVDDQGVCSLTEQGWDALGEDAAQWAREVIARNDLREYVSGADTRTLITEWGMGTSWGDEANRDKGRVIVRELGRRADRGDQEALVWLGEEG